MSHKCNFSARSSACVEQSSAMKCSCQEMLQNACFSLPLTEGKACTDLSLSSVSVGKML